MSRLLRLIVLALGVVVILTACGNDDVTVYATFDDVIDLTERSSVKVADVTVGTVEAIELDSELGARVTLRIDDDVPLPERVHARLRQTSLLGERFVELEPDPTASGRLADGTEIRDTEVVSDFESLVGAGGEVLAAVAGDRIAQALEAGATGLGGRGGTLDALLDDADTLVGRYDERVDDVLDAVDGMEALLSELAPRADTAGRAVGELARASEVLAAEDDRLLDALSDLAALSRSGTDLIDTHRSRLDAILADLDVVAGAVVADRESLDRLFSELAMHNRNTIQGVQAENVQVFADFIICGVNNNEGDPVRSCYDAPQGQPRPEVRGPQPLPRTGGGR